MIFYRDDSSNLSVPERDKLAEFVNIHRPDVIGKYGTVYRAKDKGRWGSIYMELLRTIDTYFDYWGIPEEYAKPIERVSYVLQAIPDSWIKEFVLDI